MEVNILMKDNTELKGVWVYKNGKVNDTLATTKSDIAELLNNKEDEEIFFSGLYVQGKFMPSQIEKYEIIDEDKELYFELMAFTRENSGYYDLNYPDVVGFIKDNQDELMRLLKYS